MIIRRRKTLLLDLDGTLVDPASGILACCRYAFERMGRPIPSEQDLRWIIGPPIRTTFSELLQGHGEVEEAVAYYRQLYSEWGLTQAELYPGIPEMLSKRRDDGTRLFLCTSKARDFAIRVARHFGFHSLLVGVYGSELDGRFDDKGDLIEHLLEVERLDPNDACMVGDRAHDVRAAARHGIPTVGVLWGYGSLEELTAAGAETIIERPAELLD